MKGLKVTFCYLPVTISALLKNLPSKIAEINALNGVRKMAGAADGEFFISLRDSLAVNAGRKLFIDAMVTPCASGSYIIGVDRGQWITGR